MISYDEIKCRIRLFLIISDIAFLFICSAYTGSALEQQKTRAFRPWSVLLFKFKCACIQLIVFTLLSNQFIMCTTFNDMTVIQNNDDIAVLDGG